MILKVSDVISALQEEKEILQQKMDAIDAVLEAYATPRTETRKTYHGGKAKPGTIPPGQRACSLCRQKGHRATTCPNGPSIVKKENSIPLDMRSDPDMLYEYIQKKKADGKTSVDIATELRIPIQQVNQFWNPRD